MMTVAETVAQIGRGATGARPARLTWQRGKVVAVRQETPHAKSVTFAMPEWAGHRAGQHVDIRLTAPDGYQAQRSYSIASPPEESPLVTLTVERIDDGEVSPYLTDEVQVGDTLELRGPIGGYFVWEGNTGGPLLLVAGGSGVVPLMAMLRHRAATHDAGLAYLLFSSRSYDAVIYRGELDRLAQSDPALHVTHTLTRSHPEGWTGYSRRVDRAMLEAVAPPASDHPLAFLCGPTPFVEAVAASLAAMGYDPEHIKTERFGPSGG